MRSLSKVNGACTVTGQEHGGQVCTRHLHTPFAYAINKTPYVILYWFSVKITLCMYILCDHTQSYHWDTIKIPHLTPRNEDFCIEWS